MKIESIETKFTIWQIQCPDVLILANTRHPKLNVAFKVNDNLFCVENVLKGLYNLTLPSCIYISVVKRIVWCNISAARSLTKAISS